MSSLLWGGHISLGVGDPSKGPERKLHSSSDQSWSHRQEFLPSRVVCVPPKHTQPSILTDQPHHVCSSFEFPALTLLPLHPLSPRKDAEAEGNTHQVLLGVVFTGAGRRGRSNRVGETSGTRQTRGYRRPLHLTLTPGRAGEQPGPRKTGWETAMGG